jgi:hypothetical protein
MGEFFALTPGGRTNLLCGGSMPCTVKKVKLS